MKIVHISIGDIVGGAARATYRLNKALNVSGAESYMLVHRKSIDENDIYTYKTIFSKILSRINPRLDKIPLKFYENKWFFSSALFGTDISNHPLLINADVINLHWINSGFLSLRSLRKLKQLKKPIVWTLHDMWAFTGGCHYSGKCIKYTKKCGSCPALASKKNNDLSRFIWKRKRKIYKNMNIKIVTCSRWLGDCVKQSPLLSAKDISVIPNTLEGDTFNPIESNIAKRALGLSEEKFIISFGAMRATSDKRKGFSYLVESINSLALSNPELKDKVELLVFGSTHSEEIDSLPLSVKFLGRLADDLSLALCYSAADIFVAPSVEDNLPNTVMESLACGTPVVAFNIGGMSDMIDHKRNGYLVDVISSEGLCEGLNFFIGNSKRELYRENARETFEKRFRQDIIAKSYMDVYEDLLKNT